MLALRSLLVWRTTAWWRSRSSWGVAWDPCNVQRWKHKSWVPQHRGSVGHTDGEMGWRGEGLDTTYDANTNSQGRRNKEPAQSRQVVSRNGVILNQ